MAISIARARAHTERWSSLVRSRPWPNYLFYCAHVSTAATIIRSGEVLARCSLNNQVDHDVANQDALAVNPAAHQFVRLYFRPKTRFHMRTEGIKLLSDNYRLPAHMSVPIMFLFDLEKVVTLPNAEYCKEQMAQQDAVSGVDQAYFDQIDFQKVYHDMPIMDAVERQAIHKCRMAEVLIPERLSLDQNLKHIICRSSFDAVTLKHLVGPGFDDLVSLVRTASRPVETFFCDEAYITELQQLDDRLTLKVKPPKGYTRGDQVRFNISQESSDGSLLEWNYERQLTKQPLLISGWRTDENATWTIEIDEALAFCGLVAQQNIEVIA